MNFIEKDLEDVIFESDKKELEKRGLWITGKLYRQLRIGNYGTADLVEFNRIPRCRGANITIYELKQNEINIDSFLQAIRYAKGISRYLEFRNVSFEYEISIILIGKKINDKGSFLYLPDIIPTNISSLYFLRTFVYAYEYDGIHFKKEDGYKLTHEGFGYED